MGVQFVASFILIIGSLFMYLQNHYMQNAPLGYDKEEMIIVHLNNTINKNRDAFTDPVEIVLRRAGRDLFPIPAFEPGPVHGMGA